MRRQGDKVAAKPGEKWDQSVMQLNTKRFVILRNIRNNIRRQLPQLAPHHEENPERIALVGGGWSLAETLDELRDLYFQGVKIVAVNGSARWLMERNLRPSMLIMLDARPENAEFVEKPIPRCRYFFASQIDPSILDLCEGRDVTLFHAIAQTADAEIARLDDFYMKRWARISTAGTVGVTAVMLLRILGFRNQHLFGFDSCYSPNDRAHHAYPQTLNDGEGTGTFSVAGKEFECSPWQASQVQSFTNMLEVHGELLDLTVHGDGMIAHLLKTGAALPEPMSKEA